MFKMIHDIVFHGNGGYDWHTVFNMPIWLRKFTYQQIAEYKEQESDAHKKAVGKSKKGTNIDLNNPTKAVPRSSMTPSNYMKKASRK